MKFAPSFAFLVILPVSALLLLGACDEYNKFAGDDDVPDNSCTLIGCYDQTRLDLPTDRPQRIQVRFDGEVVFDGCLEIQPNGSHVSNNQLFLNEIYSSAHVELFDLENCDQEVSFLNQDVIFSIEKTRPNGPNCSPECQMSSGSFAE